MQFKLLKLDIYYISNINNFELLFLVE